MLRTVTPAKAGFLHHDDPPGLAPRKAGSSARWIEPGAGAVTGAELRGYPPDGGPRSAFGAAP